jgi:hypothetical protein
VRRRNVWLYELERDRPLTDVHAEADAVHAQLVELLRARPADELHATFAVNPQVPPEALSASRARWQPGWPL